MRNLDMTILIVQPELGNLGLRDQNPESTVREPQEVLFLDLGRIVPANLDGIGNELAQYVALFVLLDPNDHLILCTTGKLGGDLEPVFFGTAQLGIERRRGYR